MVSYAGLGKNGCTGPASRRDRLHRNTSLPRSEQFLTCFFFVCVVSHLDIAEATTAERIVYY
jgi:hypothetical protein